MFIRTQVNKVNLQHLEMLRLSELSLVISEIKKLKPDGVKILEIGAGSGWQSKKLTERGYLVEAIDIANSNYINNRVWPIINYDGNYIPFSDEEFDVIFSSNVMEHIPHLDQFQDEIRRVLKPDGIVIHLVPSGSWSFWTILTHYPYILKLIMTKIFAKDNAISGMHAGNRKQVSEAEDIAPALLKNMARKVRNGILPRRHGERGNVVTEIYYFGKDWWVSFFQNNGWDILKYSTNQLFYSGYSIFGSSISISGRQLLSRYLGASCHLFVLNKNNLTHRTD